MPNTLSNRWQLPDGVDELLPDAAWGVERLRRRLSDLCWRAGFELVMPPLIEYVDSLLTGTGETMDLQTFKLVDQQNGRTLGLRADMTPQVARLDAHTLRRERPNRLFYTGTVVRARTDGFGGSRSPLQFGAELFGHAGPESDIEIIRLMLDSVCAAGVAPEAMVLDLGHVGLYYGMVQALDAALEAEVFAAMQRGSRPDICALLDTPEHSAVCQQLMRLFEHNGDDAILDSATAVFGDSGSRVRDAIRTLQTVVSAIRSSHAQVRIHVDLAELRGYRYHTGMLYALYDDRGSELARGGRYDDIGAAFGHARPATGFTGDLKQLALLGEHGEAAATGILVAADDVDTAQAAIRELRNDGERVVCALPGDDDAGALGCDRRLLHQQGTWRVVPV